MTAGLPSASWRRLGRCAIAAFGPTMLVAFASADPAAPAAGWPTDSLVDVAVCTADSVQSLPRLVADGSGGVIVAWNDWRQGKQAIGIYAQHVLAGGEKDPAWPPDGRALCADGLGPELVTDGAGGAIVAWARRAWRPSTGIHVHHVLAGGALDPAWPAEGVAIPSAPSGLDDPRLVPDGSGGAIIAWQDLRGRDSLSDIYVHHVLASGVVDSVWPAEGRALCTAPGNQFHPDIVPDGAGGAVVAWQDQRRESEKLSGSWTVGNIYAQHVLATGQPDPRWAEDGLCLSLSGKRQMSPRSVPDGAGGAIVVWEDRGRRRVASDLCAQHVLGNGRLDSRWPSDGLTFSQTAEQLTAPTVARDGAGGALMLWLESGSTGVLAQHVLAEGKADPRWPDYGLSLRHWTERVSNLAACMDSAGGAFVCWKIRPPAPTPGAAPSSATARRCGTLDLDGVHVQHVLASGVVDPAWPPDGRALCTAAGEPSTSIVADERGGAIVAFTGCLEHGAAIDSSARKDPDVFVKRVGGDGRLGGATKPDH